MRQSVLSLNRREAKFGRSVMVRHPGVKNRISPRELALTHKGLMGGMPEIDRKRVTRSAEARAKLDYWSSQTERERDVVALLSNRKNAESYVPGHAARRDRWQLNTAIELSLGPDPVRVCGEMCGKSPAPIILAIDDHLSHPHRVIVDLTQD